MIDWTKKKNESFTRILNRLQKTRSYLEGLQNTFLSILHSLLWNKMCKLGVGYEIMKILIDSYSKVVSVKNNSGISTSGRISRGVLQSEGHCGFHCYLLTLRIFYGIRVTNHGSMRMSRKVNNSRLYGCFKMNQIQQKLFALETL